VVICLTILSAFPTIELLRGSVAITNLKFLENCLRLAENSSALFTVKRSVDKKTARFSKN
jgi:hypothetical protein